MWLFSTILLLLLSLHDIMYNKCKQTASCRDTSALVLQHMLQLYFLLRKADVGALQHPGKSFSWSSSDLGCCSYTSSLCPQVQPTVGLSRCLQYTHMHTHSYTIQLQPAMQINTNQNQYFTGTTSAPAEQYVHL